MNKIIYLDSAATSLKPASVIDAQTEFLTKNYANAGRGICARSMAVDNMVNNARERVAKFINAEPSQIIFTSGTTDGMNRIVDIIDASVDSVVMVSDLDHHSARMPIQRLYHKLVLCPLDDEFNFDVDNIPYTDVFVITAMSNVLGCAQDVKKIIATARAKNPNVITIVDAAQYVAHMPIDVKQWDCDFLCFSVHKIGGDTGLGIMYIKDSERWNSDKFGGGMVNKIVGNEWVLADGPARFEAGTLPLTQIAGLVPAIDYLENHKVDTALIKYLHGELSNIPGVTVFTKPDAVLLSFVVDGMHCLDFGSLVGAYNICLRVGNMCATWIHERLGYNGSIRISTGTWNTMEEMKNVVETIKKILK